MIRLDRLLIRNLGNIAPGTELRFGERGALLLGKNGTGKTTLLNVIVAVLKSDWMTLHEMGRGSYDIAFELTMSAGEMPDIKLSVEVTRAPQDGARLHDYTARIFGAPPSRFTVEIALPEELPIFISYEKGDINWIHGQKSGTEKQITPSIEWALDTASNVIENNNPRLGEHRKEFISLSHRLFRFDEALIYYDILTHDDEPREFLRLNSALEPLPGVVESATAEALAASLRRRSEPQRPHYPTLDVSIDLVPRNDYAEGYFVDGVEIQPTQRDAERAALDWITDFCEMNSLDGASIHSTKNESGDGYSIFEPLRFLLRRGTRSLGHHLFSFGQKRLLSFLHYQKANPSILVADELVNGMHHEWIQHCTDKMLQQQAFLSSQNPLLFDFMAFETAEDVAQRFVNCTLDEQGRFVWSNLTPEDAAEFYRAYQTGIQHVSEILRTRGYW